MIYKAAHGVWIVLVVSVLIIFRGPLFAGMVIGDLDLPLAFLPLETLYADYQHSWQLPQWSSLLGFGHPLIGWGHLGFFIPIHVILRLLHVSPLVVVAISPAIYTLIGVFGMYGFLRSRSLYPPAAGLGAVIFAGNGFMAGHMLHTNFHVATMVLPLLLWALSSLAQGPTLRRSLWVALCLGVIAENGHPPIVLFTFIIAGIVFAGYVCQSFVVAQPHARGRLLLRMSAYTLLAGLLGFGLAAIRWLPFLEFLEQTSRWRGFSLEELYDFSIPPWHLITVVLPRFFWEGTTYWGPKGFIEMSAFTGIGPLLLSGLALSRWRSYLTERIVGLLLVGVGVALALGKYSVIYRWLIDHGWLATIGGTGRFAYVALVGIALLSAIALQDWLAGKGQLSLAGVLVLPILLVAPFIKQLVYDPAFRHAATNAQAWLGWWEVCVTAVVIIGTLLFAVPWQRQTGSMIILLIITGSFVLHHGDFYTLAPRSTLSSDTFGTLLRDYAATTGIPGRIYARKEVWLNREHMPLAVSEPVSTTEDIRLLLLEAHAQVLAQASSARWWASLPDARYEQFVETFLANSGPLYDGDQQHILERYRHLFDMSGVTHFSQVVPQGATDRLEDAGMEVIAEQSWGEHAVRLYYNPQAYPKAFLVPTGIGVHSFDDAMYHMKQASFNPAQVVYLESETPAADVPREGDLRKAAANVIAYEDTYVEVEVTTPQSAVLVLNDMANPQWQTAINGEVVPSLIANGVFRGAIVPAGHHRVTFTYASPAAYWGAIMSAASLSLILGLLLWEWWQRSQTRVPAVP